MTTDSELIASAIAAGRIRYIPQGISGIDPSTGKPLVAEPKPEARHPLRRKRRAIYKETDAQLREMFFAGEMYRTMAAKLGVSTMTVWHRCRALGLSRQENPVASRRPKGEV